MNFLKAREFAHRLMALTSLCLLLAALACVPPNREDFSPDDEVDDSGSGSPIGDDDDVTAPPASLDDDDSVDPGDDDDASIDCEPDEIPDCDGGCTLASWLADDECDSSLDCAELSFDMGDCAR